MTPRVALGYTCVSVGDADSLSLAAQEKALRAFAAAQGLALATITTDPGVSAGVPLQKRPGGSQLVRTLRHSDADGVVLIAVRLDRLFRSAYEAAKWSTEWLGAGVHLVLLDIGLDLRTEAGAAVLRAIGACAAMEGAMLRERDTARLLRSRQKPVGLPEFGYTHAGGTVTIAPHEQAAIGFMLECQDKGMSIRTGIPDELFVAGFVPRKRVWHHVTVARVLRRTRRDPSLVRLALDSLREWRAAKARAAEQTEAPR